MHTAAKESGYQDKKECLQIVCSIGIALGIRLGFSLHSMYY